MTLIKDENKLLPYNAGSGKKILMLCPYNNERAQMVMGLNRAKAAGKVPTGTEVDVYRYSGDDYAVTEGSTLKEKIDWADLVIINSEVTGSSGMSLKYWSSVGPENFTKYCKAQGKKSVILSVDKPYDVQLYPDADAVLAVYGCKGSSLDVTQALLDGEVTEDENACGPNITAGVEVLFGVFAATGKLPVTIPQFKDGSFTDETAYNNGYGLNYQMSISNSSFVYNGKIQKPVIKTESGLTLKEGTDYSVKWSNSSSKDKGTYTASITAKNGYTGPETVTYRINAKAVTPAVTLSAVSYTYNGKAKTPAVTVKDGTTTLRKNTDYTVTYSSGRKNTGSYKVTVTLKGNYSGKGTKTFKINKAANPLSIKSKTASVKYTAVKKKTQTLAVGKVITFTKKDRVS